MSQKIIKHLPFEGIKDLLHKVELIKKAHLLQKEQSVSQLIQNGISFQDISEYGVAIHLDDLTEQQVAIAMSNDNSATKEMYDLLGVTETVVNFTDEEIYREVEITKQYNSLKLNSNEYNRERNISSNTRQ